MPTKKKIKDPSASGGSAGDDVADKFTLDELPRVDFERVFEACDLSEKIIEIYREKSNERWELNKAGGLNPPQRAKYDRITGQIAELFRQHFADRMYYASQLLLLQCLFQAVGNEMSKQEARLYFDLFFLERGPTALLLRDGRGRKSTGGIQAISKAIAELKESASLKTVANKLGWSRQTIITRYKEAGYKTWKEVVSDLRPRQSKN